MLRELDHECEEVVTSVGEGERSEYSLPFMGKARTPPSAFHTINVEVVLSVPLSAPHVPRERLICIIMRSFPSDMPARPTKEIL